MGDDGDGSRLAHAASNATPISASSEGGTRFSSQPLDLPVDCKPTTTRPPYTFRDTAVVRALNHSSEPR